MRLRTLVGSLAAATTVLGSGLPAIPAAAATGSATLYVDNVSTTCTDSGPGSLDQPFCTVGAAAKVVNPGQTVLIGGSFRYSEHLNLTRSGTPDQPIVFASVARDSDVASSFIDGGLSPAVTVTGAHDVILRDLTVQSIAESFLVTDSTHITIDHNRVVRSGRGPVVRLTGSTSATVVSRNDLANAVGAAVQLDSGVSDITVTTNDITGAGGGGIVANAAPRTVVTSNTIRNSCAPEISLGDGSTGSTVENNVIAPGGRHVPYGQCATGSGTADLTVSAGAASGTTADYNTVHPDTGSTPYKWGGTGYASADAFLAATGQGKHDSTADPLVDPAQRYLPGSPAIDSADASAPGELATDLDGAPAVDDSKQGDSGTGTGYRDRGAHERQGLPVNGSLTVDDGNSQGAFPLAVGVTATVTALWQGTTLSYSFDFGDGTAPVVSATPHATHVYQSPGLYEPVVTVTDNLGSRISVQSQTPVKVSNPGPPRAAFTFQDDKNYTAPLSYDFDSTGSGGPWPITKRVFDFGDYTAKTECPANSTGDHGPTCVHTFAKPGRYQVSLTVTDKAGGTNTVTQPVTVNYRPGFLTDRRQRILDTRTGTGVPAGRLGQKSELTLNISGPTGTAWNPPVTDRNATTVVLNLTAVNPSQAGFLTVYPSATGEPRPDTSNSNFVAGQTVAHLVTVPIGPDGKIKIYNGWGSVDLVADLVAVYTPQHVDSSTTEQLSRFTPTAPTRLLDTRNGTGTGKAGKVGPKGQACFSVPAGLKLPADVTDLVLNVTATGADRDSYLADNSSTAWATSLLNFGPGQTVANQVILRPGQTSTCISNFAGNTDIVADLTGYYSLAGQSLFTPIAPMRLLDTRDLHSPFGEDSHHNVAIAGWWTIPKSATGAVLNVTATQATRPGFLTVVPYAGNGVRPTTSSVNFEAGQTVPNHVTTGLGFDGQLDFYNRFAYTDAIADLFGYFTNA